MRIVVLILVLAGLSVPTSAAADAAPPAADRGSFMAWKLGDRQQVIAADSAEKPVVTGLRAAAGENLTLVHLDRAGKPTTRHLTLVVNLDTGATVPLPDDDDGAFTVLVPPGRYQVGTFIDGSTALAQPLLEVTGAQTVTLDARLGRPIAVTAPEPDAAAAQMQLGMNTRLGDGNQLTMLYVANDPGPMYTAQIGGGGPVPGFTQMVAAQIARRDNDNSPYVYHLAYYNRGRMFTGLTRSPGRAELARVDKSFAQAAPGTRGSNSAAHSELPEGPWSYTWGERWLPFDLPFRRVEYYNTDLDVRWSNGMSDGIQWQYAGPTAYRSGRASDEAWNRAVFGPNFPDHESPYLWITRTGDRVLVRPSWFGGPAGQRRGSSEVDTRYAVSLFRDGVPVGETTDAIGDFTAPAAAGNYRLDIAADRGAPATLSTSVKTSWTFRSEHTDDSVPTRLPLSAILFAPVLDAYNSAPGGRLFAVPVTVQRQAGSAAGAVASLTVEASYDDGASWRPAAVAGGIAVLSHPAGGGFVSLRGTAVDTAGNTVTQTVIHAYRLR